MVLFLYKSPSRFYYTPAVHFPQQPMDIGYMYVRGRSLYVAWVKIMQSFQIAIPI